MKRTAQHLVVQAAMILLACPAFGGIELDSSEFVQAGGEDIVVPGYSVPSFVDWDEDGLNDLIVGEGGSGFDGKVRVYLNSGTEQSPLFAGYSYVQSDGEDLTEVPGGCQGVFPRVVYWDADGRKDLLIGLADGTVKVYLNVGTDDDPTFDSGTFLQVGNPGAKANIEVGLRATPIAVDWNNDDNKDLVVGAYDGKIHVFINEGTDSSPDFLAESYAQNNGGDLVVDFVRSSPDVLDVDGDGKLDLLSGNTDGQLLLYCNQGSAEEPSFSGYTPVETDGVPVNLPGAARSRPFACEWTGNSLVDVLIGAGDGKVYLFQGVPSLGDLDTDGDVDLDDYAVLADCTAGPGQPRPAETCTSNEFDDADLDDDGDVDLEDFAHFLALFPA